MDKFKLLRIFLLVIDHGNFSEAAKKMESSPSAVSKAILRLERTLGLQLFQRSTRQIRLTAEGQNYATQIRSLLEQIDTCEQSIKKNSEQPHGKLLINSPVSYGRLYLRPLLKSFRQLYPKISIEISYNDRHIDIIEQGYDLCIRSGTVTDSRLIARQLSPIDFLICASPEYIEKYSRPKSSRDFDKHTWIRFRYQQTGLLAPIMMPARSQYREFDPDQSFIVDDGEAMAELCADNMGLTQIPHFIARNWLRSNKIVSLFPSYCPNGHGVYIIYPKRDYLPERVNVFIKFLQQQILQQGETPRSTWARSITLYKD